jgi:exopolysaccharide production protein ExoQ
MPPPLASLITSGFIAFLFRSDHRERSGITRALWIPLLWLLVIVSKPVAVWLQILLGLQWGEAVSADSIVWITLIIAGARILAKRGVTVSEIVRNNRFLSAYVLYCFISVFWSDSWFWSFKHWIATLGHPIMALIILTEPDPKKALICLMKRCAYVVLPVSILLIRYYPEWGRSYDLWSGGAVASGIAEGKNQLGAACLIFGSFFVWRWLHAWRTERGATKRNEVFLASGFLIAIWWLLSVAKSSTPVGCLFISGVTLLLVGSRFINRRFIGFYLLAGLTLCVGAEIIFGISGAVTRALGRDTTLTGRTELWKQLLEFDINPLFGTGFDGFWIGDRVRKFEDLYGWKANEAHNGYLETYLNLGLVGLTLLIGSILAGFRKIRAELLRDFELGRFHLALFLAIVVYNWTEAGFKTLNPVWFVFYLIALDYPQHKFSSIEQPAEALLDEEDAELVYER